MATDKYKTQIVLLLPDHIDFLRKEAERLSKEYGEYVSLSHMLRIMIDAYI